MVDLDPIGHRVHLGSTSGCGKTRWKFVSARREIGTGGESARQPPNPDRRSHTSEREAASGSTPRPRSEETPLPRLRRGRGRSGRVRDDHGRESGPSLREAGDLLVRDAGEVLESISTTWKRSGVNGGVAVADWKPARQWPGADASECKPARIEEAGSRSVAVGGHTRPAPGGGSTSSGKGRSSGRARYRNANPSPAAPLNR